MKKIKMLIAGPCSVESLEQLDVVMRQLQAQSVNYLRGGIWKPRTRPGSYEGIGKKGLPWMSEMKSKYNQPIITEVATSHQVEMTLEAGFDALWIGARTTVNPFYVQEIADALRGVDIPIYVKNPINPDLSLWIGGIERLNKAVKGKVAAIHRGFSSFRKYKYRYKPLWSIPIALKQDIPDIELICDPSHISGQRRMILEVAQQALDLQFDGLMIETHPDPPNAKSDPDQQLTPSQFRELIASLIIRQHHVEDELIHEKMTHIRSHIDRLDDQLVQLLSNRMKLSTEIGEIKAEELISILQPERWLNILNRAQSVGKELDLSPEFISAFFNIIHEESINRQVEVMKSEKI